MRERLWRQLARFGALGRLRDPHLAERLSCRVVARRAGDNAVEILGEALRFGQRLPAAGRTAVEVRAPRRAVVERRHERAGFEHGLVHGALGEVAESVAAVAYPCWTPPASAGYATDPPHAPLPTTRSVPFHPATGSQISRPIEESRDGVTVASTRQNAGSLAYAAAPVRPARPPDALNAPAATSCARVIAASASESDARRSHGSTSAAAPLRAAAAAITHSMA